MALEERSNSAAHFWV